MAGVLTIQRDIKTKIPASTMFKVLVLKADTTIPQIIPQVSIELLEGDGGPGTIKKTLFSGEGSEFKCVKTKIEEIDKENFKYSYSVIEGDSWMDSLEKMTNEIEMVEVDGETIVRIKNMYFTKPNCEVDEDKIAAGADNALGLFKAAEAYMLANPDAFN